MHQPNGHVYLVMRNGIFIQNNMKNILLSFKGFENNKIFKQQDSNNFNRSWVYLKDELAKKGYDFKTVDDNNLSTAEKILFIDEVSLGIPKKEKSQIRRLAKKVLGITPPKPLRDTYNEAIKLGLRSKMVLLLWEPEVIDKDNYTEELYDKFDTVLTWNDNLVDNIKFFKYFHPYSGVEYPNPNVAFVNKKMLVNISMNKHSTHKDDLYRERRESIKFFEKKLVDQFDLFGYGWNQPVKRYERILPFLTHKYQSYRGTCEYKHQILSKYKFSLCYENIKNVNGWITEKIFDCFQARTIPIYWGAENVTDYIPKNTFIDRRDFKNNDELLKFINLINEKDYMSYINNIENFLSSKEYKVFLPENFSKILCNHLQS